MYEFHTNFKVTYLVTTHNHLRIMQHPQKRDIEKLLLNEIAEHYFQSCN